MMFLECTRALFPEPFIVLSSVGHDSGFALTSCLGVVVGRVKSLRPDEGAGSCIHGS